MKELRDNLIAFPVPSTRLLRVLLEETQSQLAAERIALRLISHVEATGAGVRCPWCRLHPPDQDA